MYRFLLKTTVLLLILIFQTSAFKKLKASTTKVSKSVIKEVTSTSESLLSEEDLASTSKNLVDLISDDSTFFPLKEANSSFDDNFVNKNEESNIKMEVKFSKSSPPFSRDRNLDASSFSNRKPRVNNLHTSDFDKSSDNNVTEKMAHVENNSENKSLHKFDNMTTNHTSTDYSLEYPYENLEDFEAINLNDFTLPPFTLNPVASLLHFNETFPLFKPEELSVSPLFRPTVVSHVDSVLSKILNGPDRNVLFENATAEQIYQYLEKLIQNQTEHLGNQLLPRLVYMANKLKLQPECRTAINAILNGISEKQDWALRFLDSTGKFNPRLFHGTFTELGNFDECIKIEAKTNIKLLNETSFSGKYCLSNIQPPFPSRKFRMNLNKPRLNYKGAGHENMLERYYHAIKLGICVPSVCTREEIAKIFNEIAYPFNYSMNITYNCTMASKKLENDDFPGNAVTIYSFVLIFSVLGTTMDVLKHKKNKACFKTFLSYFSIPRNSKKFFNLKNHEFKSHILESPSFLWLNGIQVWTMFWLIVSNFYLLGGLPIAFLLENLYQNYTSRAGSMLFQLILNSWDYVAQTFFFISGFTICISILKTKYPFPVLRIVVYTWFSWAPSIISVMMACTIIFHSNWKSGPVFTLAEKLILGPCDQKAWANVVFWTNLFSFDKLCLPHLWYISALFQLKLVSALVIYILKVLPLLGIIIVLFFILIGIVLPGFNTYVYQLSPLLVLADPYSEQIQGDISLQLLLTYNHFSSYFLGVLIAYKIVNRTTKYTTKFFRLLAWVIFSAISLFSILITLLWNSSNEQPSLTISTLYSSLHRIAWVSGLAWMTHEFSLERGGFLRKFFSFKIFKKLNKLTYQVYLIHLILIWYLFFTSKSTLIYHNFELWMNILGIVLASLVLGYFNYIFFEAPFKSIFQGFMKFLESWNLKARMKELDVNDNENKKNPDADFQFSGIDGCSSAAKILAEEKMCEDDKGVVIRL